MSTINGNGVTYTVPHFDFDSEPPYDMSEATEWERQEIRYIWRDAQRAARSMFECADLWLGRLEEVEPHVSHMNASGDSIPLYAAQNLTLALVRLQTRIDGMKHRLAMNKKATP